MALSTDEWKSSRHLQTISVFILEDACEKRLSMAKLALKKRRMDATADSAGAHIDLSLLLPTSSNFERLSSKEGCCLMNRKQNLQPSQFESRSFLHENKEYWGLLHISAILKRESGCPSCDA